MVVRRLAWEARPASVVRPRSVFADYFVKRMIWL